MEEYLTKEEFNRYRRFMNMQAQSLFVQIEELRDRIERMEPIQPLPKGRKEMLDKQVANLFNKVNFLESLVNKQKIEK